MTSAATRPLTKACRTHVPLNEGVPVLMSHGSLAARADAVLPPTANRVTRLGIVRASGSRMWDEFGRVYLDFTCGVGVTNVGHNHPDVLAKTRDQLDVLVHGGHNVVYYPSYVELAERLAATVSEDEYRVYFSNSGAEALEAAVKLCMQATGRGGLVAFQRGFHGRTLATTALGSSTATYRDGYGEAMPTVHHLPFPYALRSRRDTDEEVRSCLDAFDRHLQLVAGPGVIAAVVMEPVLGEGGYLPAPPAFVQGIAERCQSAGIPLVFDEIQTGFGRTGRLFAYEDLGVEPDVLVLAKGIANGLPLSAMLARDSLMRAWPAGTHGGTYGGNPVACAAALAVLDLIDDDLLARVRKLGTSIMDALRDISAGYPGRVDVRGRGLMIGVEFLDENDQPDAGIVARIRHRCEEAGLLLLPCGADRNVIRLIPPLTVEDADVDEALHVMAAAIQRG